MDMWESYELLTKALTFWLGIRFTDHRCWRWLTARCSPSSRTLFF
jgi:hypothetical protein